jgi:hypothetical protein
LLLLLRQLLLLCLQRIVFTVILIADVIADVIVAVIVALEGVPPGFPSTRLRPVSTRISIISSEASSPVSCAIFSRVLASLIQMRRESAFPRSSSHLMHGVNRITERICPTESRRSNDNWILFVKRQMAKP